MKLQTKISLEQATHQINYQSRLLLLGSCFVQNIGTKLSHYKFQNLQNPFGILFQPIAIENLVTRAVYNSQFAKEDVFYNNGRWQCFEAHSYLSHMEKEQLILDLNESLDKTSKQIRESTHLIITLGTAWAYRYKNTKTLVANCHKVPQTEFTKELLSVQEISRSLEGIIEAIGSVNNNATIVFTISPVRHLKDGFVENQRSKSHLFAALHQILERDRVSYFPSYEIMMDELRDYRFYQADMVHPNELAINYIWERFMEAWIAKEALDVMQKVDEIQKGLLHRPFNANSEQYQKFTKSLEKKITYLQEAYPFMEFAKIASRD